eukprot:6472959-Amphidinium_carterae.1
MMQASRCRSESDPHSTAKGSSTNNWSLQRWYGSVSSASKNKHCVNRVTNPPRAAHVRGPHLLPCAVRR